MEVTLCKSMIILKHNSIISIIREFADALQWESLVDVYSVGSIREGQVVERLWD